MRVKRRRPGAAAPAGAPAGSAEPDVASEPAGSVKLALGRPGSEVPLADGDASPADEAEQVTLETICLCGHQRREHRGMRMQTRGSCLTCDCERFTTEHRPQVQTQGLAERLAAALARLERLAQLIENASRAGGALAQRPHPGADDRAGAAAQLRIAASGRGMIISLGERLRVHLGSEEAMVVLVEDPGAGRQRLLWRGPVSAASAAQRTRQPGR